MVRWGCLGVWLVILCCIETVQMHIPTETLGGGEKPDYFLTGWLSVYEPSEVIYDSGSSSYFFASAGLRAGQGMTIRSIAPLSTRLEKHEPLWPCEECNKLPRNCNNTFCPLWPMWWGTNGNITGRQNGVVRAPSLSYSKSGTVLYYHYSSIENRTRRDCIGRATQQRYVISAGNLSWVDDGRPVLCSSFEGREKVAENPHVGAIARNPHIIRDAATNMPYLIYGYRGAGIHAVALDERDSNGAYTGYSTADVFNTYNNDTWIVTKSYSNVTKTETTSRKPGGRAIYHRIAQYKQWYTKDSTIEAPFMYYHPVNQYYYLFFVVRRTFFAKKRTGSFKYDKYLRRVVDTRRWEVRVCRSKSITGPFRDKRFKHCGFNGGSLLFSDEGRYRKISQPAVSKLNGTILKYGEEYPAHDYIFSFHFVKGSGMPVEFEDQTSWYDDYEARFVDDSVWDKVETIATINETIFNAWHLEWETFSPIGAEDDEVDDEGIDEDDEFSVGTCARPRFLTRADCEGRGFEWTVVKTGAEDAEGELEGEMDDIEHNDMLWPVITNRTWDPSHVVRKPPPPFRLTTLQLIIIFSSTGLCCSTCIGILAYMEKRHKFAQQLLFTVRIYVFDHCFEPCRCLLVRSIAYKSYLYQRYEDPLGNLGIAFQNNDIKPQEQFQWLRLWDRLIVEENSRRREHSNVLSFRYFIDYFELEDEPPILQRRIFSIFNANLKGGLTLPEFLNTCVKFCVSDVVYLHELAFKLISRHGSTLSLASGTLEEMDVNDIITQRYKDTGMTQMQIQRVARAVFLHIDDDASGGIAFQEFIGFSRKCPTFLLMPYSLHLKFRQKIFGDKYWTAFTEERLDIFRPSKWFDERLGKMLENDYTPYHWSKDFADIYEKHRGKKLGTLQAKLDREALSIEELQKRYATMRRLIASMFRRPTTLKGAYDTWKLVLVCEEILPGNNLPKGSIHQMIMEEHTEQVDVLDLLNSYEAKYLGGFEMTNLQTTNKEAGDNLPDELDIVMASAALSGDEIRGYKPSFDLEMLSTPGTSRGTSRASSAMTDSTYMSSLPNSSRPSSYAPSSRPSSIASSSNFDGSSRPSSIATNSRPSSMAMDRFQPQEGNGGFLSSFNFGSGFFASGPLSSGINEQKGSSASSDDVLGVGPPRSAGYLSGRRLRSAGLARTGSRFLRQTSRGDALIYPGTPSGDRRTTSSAIVGDTLRPSTEGRMFQFQDLGL